MQPIPKEIIITAERLLYHNELLIAQCDRWLSAEEGNRNMERKIYERNKKEAAKARAVYRNALRPKTWYAALSFRAKREISKFTNCK